jgi:CRP/FNR family cyclic AMP-dependent transcriptional regulator
MFRGVTSKPTISAVYSTRDKVQILSRVALFAELPEHNLNALAEITGTRSLRAKEELFHKGDEANELYVVVSGRLKITTTSKDGNDLMFGLTGAGEVCGEIALLTQWPRTASVRALEATSLLTIGRRQLHTLLLERPEVGIALLSVVATRVAKLSLLLEDTQFLNLPIRLARKLRDFAAIYGKPDVEDRPGAVKIDLKLSQEEWGDLVGTTRESINKQFRAWTEGGMISINAQMITILDAEEISSLADCRTQ